MIRFPYEFSFSNFISYFLFYFRIHFLITLPFSIFLSFSQENNQVLGVKNELRKKRGSSGNDSEIQKKEMNWGKENS